MRKKRKIVNVANFVPACVSWGVEGVKISVYFWLHGLILWCL